MKRPFSGWGSLAGPLTFSDFLRKSVSKKIVSTAAAVGTPVAEPCNDKKAEG